MVWKTLMIYITCAALYGCYECSERADKAAATVWRTNYDLQQVQRKLAASQREAAVNYKFLLKHLHRVEELEREVCYTEQAVEDAIDKAVEFDQHLKQLQREHPKFRMEF